MSFNHLSVGRKLWAIVFFLMASLVALAFGVQQYTVRIEEETARNVAYNSERIATVLRWKGMTALAVERQLIAVAVDDAKLVQRLQEQVNAGIAEISVLQKRIVESTRTDEGKAQLARVGEARAEVLKAKDEIQSARSAGDLATAQRLVAERLQTAVGRYGQAQEDFLRLQERRRSEAQAAGEQARVTAQWLGAGITLLVLAVGAFLAWLTVRSITEPLQRAVGMADAIKDGDLTQDVHDERGDELGHLLRALSAMGAQLRAVVGEVRAGVESVSSASSQIASGNQDLSSRTEQTAASLEQTAASMEELTATVTQSADTAHQANQLVANAALVAQHGGEVVGQVVSSMEHITASSRKISDIIGVIDGIAFQTNILALNAAVEAARAGEQGRGFAVVAGEVRSLAQRSAEAAKEIKGLITASVHSVEAGSQQVEQAGQSMEEIVAAVRRVSDLIGEITASTREQRDGIGQVNQAVANLDQMTQQNAALVEQSSAAATAMHDQAQRLAQVVSVFNVGAQTVASAPARTAALQRRPAAAPAKPLAPTPARARVAVAAKPAAVPAPRLGSSQPKATAATTAATAAQDDWESF